MVFFCTFRLTRSSTISTVLYLSNQDQRQQLIYLIFAMTYKRDLTEWMNPREEQIKTKMLTQNHVQMQKIKDN